MPEPLDNCDHNLLKLYDADVTETLNYLLDRVQLDLAPEASDDPDSSIPSDTALSDTDLYSEDEVKEQKTEELEPLEHTGGKDATEESGRNQLAEDVDVFKLKDIQFNSAKISMVTQNLNGPCPLIALVNLLVLKGVTRLPNNEYVTRDTLTHLVADALLQLRPDKMDALVESNYNKNLEDVINLLPELGRGLDVNVRFRHVTDFEFTPALCLFDLLHVNLYHGWLPDPQFVEIKNAVGNLTYNQLVEQIFDEKNPNRFLLEEFLSENVTQLTYHGLIGIMEAMKDGELAVLFRNNHFHTILKRKELLYLLVSDSGYANEPSIVWESFNNVDGSSIFFAGDFTVGTPRSSCSRSSQKVCTTDADFLLAQEMQACEEQLARHEAEKARQVSSPTLPLTSTGERRDSALGNEEYVIPRSAGPIVGCRRQVMTNPGSKDKKCIIS